MGAPKYEVLGFVQYLEEKDPARYKEMKKQMIIVEMSRIPSIRDEGYKSHFTATWGKIRVCVDTKLGVDQLEQRLRWDMRTLGEEGIWVSLQGDRRRIGSQRQRSREL